MENRPNIVTVGALGGALSLVVCWIANTVVFAPGPAIPAEVGIAISTIITAGLQWLDRLSKRAAEHVINKYGSTADASAQTAPPAEERRP